MGLRQLSVDTSGLVTSATDRQVPVASGGHVIFTDPLTIDPCRYGAKPDVRKVTDAVITGGALSTLTSATAAFTAADTGKHVNVPGAGDHGGWLSSAITYVNATTVTLTTAALTAVNLVNAWIGTDSRDGFQQAFDRAGVLATLGLDVTIRPTIGRYLFDSNSTVTGRTDWGVVWVPVNTGDGSITLEGAGCTIQLGAGQPIDGMGAFSPLRRSDGDTLYNLTLRDFNVDWNLIDRKWDATLSGGAGNWRGARGYAVFSSGSGSAQHLNYDNVKITGTRSYNLPLHNTLDGTVNTPNTGHILVTSWHSASGQATSTIKGVHIEGCRMYGGCVGAAINGSGTSAVEVFIDEWVIRDCLHDYKVLHTQATGSSFLVGNWGYCGTGVIENCFSYKCADTAIELDGHQKATCRNNYIEDCTRNAIFLYHFHQPAQPDSAVYLVEGNTIKLNTVIPDNGNYKCGGINIAGPTIVGGYQRGIVNGEVHLIRNNLDAAGVADTLQYPGRAIIMSTATPKRVIVDSPSVVQTGTAPYATGAVGSAAPITLQSGGNSATDGAMTSASTTLTSATAGFTTFDVGKIVRVAGAGAGGAQLVSRIASYTNATTVVLEDANASGGDVSGKVVSYGFPCEVTIRNPRIKASGTPQGGSSAITYQPIVVGGVEMKAVIEGGRPEIDFGGATYMTVNGLHIGYFTDSNMSVTVRNYEPRRIVNGSQAVSGVRFSGTRLALTKVSFYDNDTSQISTASGSLEVALSSQSLRSVITQWGNVFRTNPFRSGGVGLVGDAGWAGQRGGGGPGIIGPTVPGWYELEFTLSAARSGNGYVYRVTPDRPYLISKIGLLLTGASTNDDPVAFVIYEQDAGGTVGVAGKPILNSGSVSGLLNTGAGTRRDWTVPTPVQLLPGQNYLVGMAFTGGAGTAAKVLGADFQRNAHRLWYANALTGVLFDVKASCTLAAMPDPWSIVSVDDTGKMPLIGLFES